jgi:riboflavin kinase/FMN adenylyltransferase
MDFTGEIYGQSICLSFVEKLRNEQRFGSLEELVAQISLDRDRALEITRAYHGNSDCVMGMA